MPAILYNTTFFVHSAVRQAFLDFLRGTYVPVSLKAGMTVPYIAALRDTPGSSDDSDYNRFAVQMFADDDSVLNVYCGTVQSELLETARVRWGQQVLCMPSVMDILYYGA